MSMDQGPVSPRPQSNRSRGFSFRSQGSGSNKDHAESPEEKKRRDSLWKGGSKANPNAALTEAQPGVANLNEETTLHNLRATQHLDANGNLIAEPDLSNPTRPRFERPLDTIRSFEKAIDNGYKRRSSYQRAGNGADTYDPNNQFASRRSSAFFGGESPRPPQRSRRSIANMLGPDAGSPSNRQSMVGGGGYYGTQQRESYYGAQRPRGHSMRVPSESQLNGQRPYGQPHHGYHQSYDTVQTGYTNGSDSTGPWANSTDPSSENSSIDRNMAMNNGKPQTPMDGYGYNGPIMEEQQGYDQYPQDGYGGSPQMPQQARYGGGPVQPPPAARRPIPLGNSGGSEYTQGGTLPSAPRGGGGGKEEKRKSWLKRRFSKG